MLDHFPSRGLIPLNRLILIVALLLVSSANFVMADERTSARSAPIGPVNEVLLTYVPPVLPGTGWRAEGPARVLTGAEFAIVAGGDVFAEYGLQRVALQRYRQSRARMLMEVFEMRFNSGAFGLYTFHRNSLPAGRHELVAGRYLVSILTEGGTQEIDRQTVDAVAQLFASIKPADLPPLVKHLPDQNKIAGSEKYLVGPAALGGLEGFSDIRSSIDFTGGVEIVTANYQTGNGITRLMMIEYHTPQSALAGYDAAMNRHNARTEEEKGRRILKRVGNYVVEAIVDGDSSLGTAIVNQVKYEQTVYWEGKKLSDIPLAYRPPDPFAIEEMRETATVLVQTFYAIGFMLASSVVVGVFAGWAVFYWRRQRRRRLGMDNLFSDAGETVRLNLDEFLFQPKEPPIKLLGKGDV